MKELSIEEKAARYDEATKRAKLKIKNDKDHVLYEDDIIEIFPELKESEDEKIRKHIIKVFRDHFNGEDCDKCIAWLEKQGEQKPTDKVEPKFKVGDVVTNKKSKDTVKIVQILHDSYCYSGWDGAATVHSDFSISEQDDWELVKQKPAWSEEDDYIIEILLCLLNNEKENYPRLSSYFQDIEKTYKWLKSLKERYTWKPSEKQMDALQYVYRNLNPPLTDKLGWDSLKTLELLYQDLEKL